MQALAIKIYKSLTQAAGTHPEMQAPVAQCVSFLTASWPRETQCAKQGMCEWDPCPYISREVESPVTRRAET